MSFEFIKKLPTPEEIRNQYPIDAELQALKEKRDAEIRDVFTGKSDKFLAIIGPCSADNEDAVCYYLLRLRKVQEKIEDKVLIIPRVYTNKPRTTGEGYKGMVHQPDPEKKPNLLAGLIAIRKMHMRAIRESGFTCADEMLYPENYRYLSDLLSYVAVGARSVEDQQHRLTVSGMDVPAGMKNPTSGDYSVMLNSIVAAQGAHRFIYRSWEVETTGNPLSHAILRGAVNKHGEAIPNYHYEDLRLLYDKYHAKNLANPAVIVDTNHSNSNKHYEQQVRIASEVLHSRQVDPELHTMVKEITEGQGKKEFTDMMEEIGEAMTFSTPCTMGQTASDFAMGSLKYFAGEYEDHIKKKKCANNVCSAFMSIYIDPDLCEGCEECADVCPADAIEGKSGYIHMIDEFECTKCGKCISACENDAIIQTNGRLPKLPTRLTKCGKFKKRH